MLKSIAASLKLAIYPLGKDVHGDAGTAPLERGAVLSCGGAWCGGAVVRLADVVHAAPPTTDLTPCQPAAGVVARVEPQAACGVPREHIVADGVVPVAGGDQGGHPSPPATDDDAGGDTTSAVAPVEQQL